jgi:hypothetical protein
VVLSKKFIFRPGIVFVDFRDFGRYVEYNFDRRFRKNKKRIRARRYPDPPSQAVRPMKGVTHSLDCYIVQTTGEL